MDTNKKWIAGAVCLLLVLSICEIALPDGFLFGRLRQRRQQRQMQRQVQYQQSQYCPGGVCPVPQNGYWQEPVTYWVEPAPVIEQPTQQSAAPPFPTAQSTINFPERLTVAESRDSFRRSIIKALRAARQSNALTAGEALKIRVAMLSPSFRNHAKTLCLVQMASSTKSDLLPRNDDGTIDVEEVDRDWAGFTDFLERFVPLLLELLLCPGS